jgi:hypothetical protein
LDYNDRHSDRSEPDRYRKPLLQMRHIIRTRRTSSAATHHPRSVMANRIVQQHTRQTSHALAYVLHTGFRPSHFGLFDQGSFPLTKSISAPSAKADYRAIDRLAAALATPSFHRSWMKAPNHAGAFDTGIAERDQSPKR